MPIAQSKLTAQGQISVPTSIRRKLGVGPGSIIEWDEAGGNVVVRRSARYSSDEIHRALFATTPPTRTLAKIKEGIHRAMKQRHPKPNKRY